MIRDRPLAQRVRWTELMLLPLPLLFLILGLGLLSLARPGTVQEWHFRGAAAMSALLLFAHLVLLWRSPRADQLLLPMVAMLVGVGLVVVTRLTPELALRQLLWVALGFTLMIGTVLFLPSVAILQSYKYSAAILGLLLVGTTFVLGTDPNDSGVRSWLALGGMMFQPSEILKVLLAIFLAAYLEDKRELLTWSSSRLVGLKLPPLPYLGPLAVMWALSMAMLVAQRDVGAALLFFCIYLAMLYVASSRAIYVWGGLAAFAAGAYFCFLLFAHIRLRVEVWLDPWSFADAQGYQIVQALVAMATGGLVGSGLGQGYPGFIPAVHTDFVIAAIGEEFGLVGTLGVVALFMLLVYRGFRIALDASHAFSSLLATGLTTILGVQAFVILAGTTKLIPLTGITLPFVSYGGSSIITNFIIIGLLLRVSADRGGDRGD
ncbi:MAG: FtsW/RodA/SpoVE family cell cycle protein [Sphingomonadaceae bacterium]